MKAILDQPAISRVRRNHGLEHATIHLLTEKKFPGRFMGWSDHKGFWLMGEISTEELVETVTEALERLRSGEHNLAVHPNCGTNYVTSGVAAGVGAFIGMAGVGKRWRDKLERLPLVILLATLALILVKPLGLRLQAQVTTSGQPDQLKVTEVRKTMIGNKTAHRVVTKG